MNKKEVNVLVLGGSGYLGRAAFERLQSTEGIKVVGTYYENKPKWADDGVFSYFNANAAEIDAEVVAKIKQSDFIIDLMSTQRKDYIDNVLFNTPLKIAEIATDNEGVFISFNDLANTYVSETKSSKASQRLSNVISEKNIGISVSLSPVISSSAEIIQTIKVLTKYKITPIMGDGSNKIDAIHRTDFSMVITRLIRSQIKSGKFHLIGSNTMTIRHLFNVTASEYKQPTPIFFSISEKIFVKYKGIIESIFGISISDSDIEVLGYKESLMGKSLTKELKVKPLSFDARVKREGL